MQPLSSHTVILGIESSCDDTGASIIKDGVVLSNCIANQEIHKRYGGVVPELASRAHQQNIIPVVAAAIKDAGISKKDISAVAFTRGPGLIGSLLVGTSFAKSFAMGMNIPLIEVNHMQGHVLAHFIEDSSNKSLSFKPPKFPFLCLTVSGGHTQIVLVEDYLTMRVIGETIDDAAGEAFDKSAKLLGLPYPGGPLIDKLAKEGDALAFKFATPTIPELNFSFSGLKTSISLLVQKGIQQDALFIEKNKTNLAASIQKSIIDILLQKIKLASSKTGINQIALAGGVAANSGLRAALTQAGTDYSWDVYIPSFAYCTDNAAMIAITGYYKYLHTIFCDQQTVASARYPL